MFMRKVLILVVFSMIIAEISLAQIFNVSQYWTYNCGKRDLDFYTITTNTPHKSSIPLWFEGYSYVRLDCRLYIGSTLVRSGNYIAYPDNNGYINLSGIDLIPSGVCDYYEQNFILQYEISVFSNDVIDIKTQKPKFPLYLIGFQSGSINGFIDDGNYLNMHNCPPNALQTLCGNAALNKNIKVLDSNFSVKKFALNQNYPNPFNPETRITYSIPKASEVSLKVYDVLGNEITTLVNEMQEAGTYETLFDGSKLTTGIYFYIIRAGEFTATKKLLLQK